MNVENPGKGQPAEPGTNNCNLNRHAFLLGLGRHQKLWSRNGIPLFWNTIPFVSTKKLEHRSIDAKRGMVKKARSSQRREKSLSRDRIIEASIEILDSSGEDGLTFRALAERLTTGAGAIYWHVANKNDLLTTACDAIVAAR